MERGCTTGVFILMSDRRLLNIGFLHPDLGLGGAERLVLDAALHLQAVGHRVTFFTTHHDSGRCFEETRNGTLDMRVYGDFLPSHAGQRLRAPCAIARMAYLTCAVALYGNRFDVIFCDLVAHAMPLLKCFSRAKILFYCHFPDQLLAPRRNGLYHLYRAPIDRLEALSTGVADRVLVNSHFTAAILRQTFPHLHKMPLEVLYPGVDGTRYESCPADRGSSQVQASGEDARDVLILSINRYERKKNLGLVVEALALLRERLTSDGFAHLRLVIAGGYDDRLRENRETLLDLQALVQRHGLRSTSSSGVPAPSPSSLRCSRVADVSSTRPTTNTLASSRWKRWRRAAQWWQSTVEAHGRPYGTSKRGCCVVRLRRHSPRRWSD